MVVNSGSREPSEALTFRRCRHRLQSRVGIILAMRPHAATRIAPIIFNHRIGARLGQHPSRRSTHWAQTVRHDGPILLDAESYCFVVGARGRNGVTSLMCPEAWRERMRTLLNDGAGRTPDSRQSASGLRCALLNVFLPSNATLAGPSSPFGTCQRWSQPAHWRKSALAE